MALAGGVHAPTSQLHDINKFIFKRYESGSFLALSNVNPNEMGKISTAPTLDMSIYGYIERERVKSTTRNTQKTK